MNRRKFSLDFLKALFVAPAAVTAASIMKEEQVFRNEDKRELATKEVDEYKKKVRNLLATGFVTRHVNNEFIRHRFDAPDEVIETYRKICVDHLTPEIEKVIVKIEVNKSARQYSINYIRAHVRSRLLTWKQKNIF